MAALSTILGSGLELAHTIDENDHEKFKPTVSETFSKKYIILVHKVQIRQRRIPQRTSCQVRCSLIYLLQHKRNVLERLTLDSLVSKIWYFSNSSRGSCWDKLEKKVWLWTYLYKYIENTVEMKGIHVAQIINKTGINLAWSCGGGSRRTHSPRLIFIN